ncbi:MAG TPA: AMP-binding protein [Candidatus Binatia bacterium]|nr:AMP-binding protein [Candidatus Binatia bacterium]
MARTSLLEYLDNFRRHAREAACVHRRGYRTERWTYGDVLGGAQRFARELETRGIGKGDKVLIWGENCAEWVAAFFGCLLRGAIVVPIDRIAAPDFAQRVAQQVEAKLCVGSARNEVPGIAWLHLEGLREEIAAHPDSPVTPPALARDDIVEIVFTSGTTAEPRGVVISHGNILANLEPLEREIGNYRRYERVFHPLRFVNLLPLSHVFGQFLGIFLPQLLAATVIFQESLNPSEVLQVIKKERASVVVAVPRLMESLKDKIERDMEVAGRQQWFQRQFAAAKDEHFVKRWWRFRRIHNRFGWKFWAFISGGAALDAGTEEFWRRLSFVVIQGYGLTETTSLISLNHPFRSSQRSIGKVLEGREIRLDESGEILVRGANVAAGYWQGKELKPVLNEEGWFHTGDIGELDAEGNLYFKGRRKNVIVTREGMKVYPEDLEAALRRQPGVRDCVVVGLDQGGNAEPCAVLVLRDSLPRQIQPRDSSGAMDAQAVVREANRQLADYQQIRRWLVWPDEDFPRTPTQKPQTAVIQAAVQQHLASDGAGPAAQSALADLIARITGRRMGTLAPGASLESDLNLNSMDRVELMSALEDRYQVDLDQADFTKVSTVADLERLLRQPEKSPFSGYRYPRWAQRWPVTWIREVVYYLLSWPATMIMAHPKIVGRENLHGVRGPLLISCNHVTYVDVGFALRALPPRLRRKLAVGMWGELLWEMWRPPRSWNPFLRLSYKVGYYLVVALFNVFPLPQQSGVRESFAYAGESVDRAYNVLVYSEGQRTPDGRPTPFRSGLGMLAARLNVPVLPMRIDGLWEMKQKGHRIARPGQLRVVIGKPMRFPPQTPPDEITNQVEHMTWTM